MSDNSVFIRLNQALGSLGADLHPSELHGMIVGYLCASKVSSAEQRKTLFRHWLGISMPPELLTRLERIYLRAQAALDEYSDFNFRLVLPNDDEPVQLRSASLAIWCAGFLSGFGETGGQVDDSLSQDALNDLAKIAAIDDEVPESEENEADLTELIEHVRISVLLVYSETASRGNIEVPDAGPR